jgi:hypothetical protein
VKTLTAARKAHNQLLDRTDAAASTIDFHLGALVHAHDGEQVANFFATTAGEIAMERYLLARGRTRA